MAERIKVTAADDHLGQIDQLADSLRAAGMEVDQVLRPIGIITGSVSEAARQSLHGLPGVAAVEDETTFQIPPPESEIQ
ncbi:MAG TPA: hypothetical protein VF101_00170 [Gaiellaceae bacterium]